MWVIGGCGPYSRPHPCSASGSKTGWSGAIRYQGPGSAPPSMGGLNGDKSQPSLPPDTSGATCNSAGDLPACISKGDCAPAHFVEVGVPTRY